MERIKRGAIIELSVLSVVFAIYISVIIASICSIKP